jgi:methyl-accepting chemotaxis protein
MKKTKNNKQTTKPETTGKTNTENGLKLKTLILFAALCIVVMSGIVYAVSTILIIQDQINTLIFNMFFRAIVISLVITVAIGLVIGLVISRILSKPLVAISDRLAKLAQGDLGSRDLEDLHPITSEYRELKVNLTDCVVRMDSYISDIDNVLSNVANGNLNVRSEADYIGEFISIGESLSKILYNLNSTFSVITRTAEVVSDGSEQISGSAQNLANGSTEIAASLQMLNSNMENINDRLADTVADTSRADSLTDLVQQSVREGSEKMQVLLGSMNEITHASEDISNINKVIDEIAFQTNILALNAAVEAARAGVAGRGFSVVADEVRMLANRCADAASNTASLIGQTLIAVQNGSLYADDTAEALDRILRQVVETSEVMGSISAAAIDQSSAVSGINKELERISRITNDTSSASVEFASTSKSFEESSQQLKQSVSKFKLR